MKIKKLVFSLVTGITGFLLILAGLNLIELSSQLVLYSGIALLILAIISYLILWLC